MELTDVRTQIDSIDSQLLELFCRRMDLAQEVAAAKKGMKKASTQVGVDAGRRSTAK